MNASEIVDRLKLYFSVKTDKEVAACLGVERVTVSMWKNRDSLDLKLIVTKCDNVNLNWLLRGQGNMYSDEASDSSAKKEIEHLKEELEICIREKRAVTKQLIEYEKGEKPTQAERVLKARPSPVNAESIVHSFA